MVACFEDGHLLPGFRLLPAHGIGIPQEAVRLAAVEIAPAIAVFLDGREPAAVLGVILRVGLVGIQPVDDFLGQPGDLVVAAQVAQRVHFTLGDDDPGVQAVDAGRAAGQRRADFVQLLEAFFLMAEVREGEADLGLGTQHLGLIAPGAVQADDFGGVFEVVLVVLSVPVDRRHQIEDVQPAHGRGSGVGPGGIVLEQFLADIQGFPPLRIDLLPAVDGGAEVVSAELAGVADEVGRVEHDEGPLRVVCVDVGGEFGGV